MPILRKPWSKPFYSRKSFTTEVKFLATLIRTNIVPITALAVVFQNFWKRRGRNLQKIPASPVQYCFHMPSSLIGKTFVSLLPSDLRKNSKHVRNLVYKKIPNIRSLRRSTSTYSDRSLFEAGLQMSRKEASLCLTPVGSVLLAKGGDQAVFVD